METENEMLTDEEKRTIQTMWRENYTGGQIAAAIKHTRSSVMGYVHRAIKAGLLELKTVKNPKPVTLVKPAEPKPKTLIPKLKTQRSFRTYTIESMTNRIHNSVLKRTTLNATPEPEIVGKGIPLIKLKDHHCRHLFDENVTHKSLFCGREVFKRSYCEEHYLMYYVPTPKIRKELKNANNTLIVRK